MPVIQRVRSNGEHYVPHRFRDGFFRVADPKLGAKKHHRAHQIPIKEMEIAIYLAKGYPLRMRGTTSGQCNLISAPEISIVP